jgi:hypothetical protein
MYTITDLWELVKADLRKSAIDDETIELNFEPIEAEDTFEAVYPDARQLNNGTLPSYWARKFNKVDDFIGWWCNGRIRHLAGSPYRDEEGKPIRYLSATGRTTPITFIKPSRRAVRKVEARFNMKKPPNVSFWDWVIAENLPVILTEGEKKAASLLCAGLPAISLPGIFTGFRAIKDGWGRTVERLLREELAPFDTTGRSICVMFDYRSECAFENSVEFKAACILSRQFKRASLTVAELPGPQKGVDDYIYEGLLSTVEEVIANSKPATKLEHTRLWRQYRGFDKNGKKTRDRFFTAPEPKPNTVTIIKSNLNSGKSEWYAVNVAKAQEDDQGKIRSQAEGIHVSIGHRNSLQEQLCNRWGYHHLDIHNAYGLLKDPNLHVALCFDSILKLPIEIFPGATVAFDEVITGLKHLLCSSTLRGKRLEIINRIEYIIRVCSRVVAMDGNMSDWFVEYVRKVAPDKEIVCYDNTSDRPVPPLYFVDDSSLTKRQTEEWLNLQILDCDLPVVVVDSIIKAEAIADQLRALKGPGLLITSKTITEKWAREAMADPDEYIRKHPGQVNWIVCTPTVESGVSINTERLFHTVYCWFVGVVGVNEAVQMSRRVRNPGQVVVYAPKVGINHSRNSGGFEQIIIEDIATRIELEAGMFADTTIGDKVEASIKAQLSSPAVIAWAKIQAIQFLENRNYRDFLFIAFEDMGMKPQYIQAYQTDSEAYRTAKIDAQLAECAQIYSADDITEVEADSLSRKLDSNWDDRCKVLKFGILQAFPGIRDSPLWSADFIHRLRYRERNLRSGLEMFWLLNHPEESEALRAQKWQGKDDIDFFIPDRARDDRWLILKALRRLRFQDFLDGHEFSDKSEDVLKFVGMVRSHKSISRVIGHPGGLTNLAFFARTILPMFGIKLVKRQIRLPVISPDAPSERVYFHRYDRARCHTQNFEELLGYIEAKFRSRLQNPTPTVEDLGVNDSNLDGEDVSAVVEDETLSRSETNYVITPELPENIAGGAVMDGDIYINKTAPTESDPENRPLDGDGSGEAVEIPPDGAIEGDWIEDARSDGLEHKFEESDFVAVWVRTRIADRPEIERAILVDCEGDGFSVVIEGVVFVVPVADLLWEPPEPS